jgi:GNAT superfamily N-acetyltransferase
MSQTRADVNVRAYRDADEPRVLELLAASLGGGPAGERPSAFFRWKHLENPFGRSIMLVAEDGGRIVGLRAFMRWRFTCEGRSIEAVRAVDTATHPDHQGRGIFSRLTREALDLMRGEIDLVFNTPNEKSLPGYLKMGWGIVGTVPISLRVRRPVRFARGIGSSRAASHGGATAANPDLPEASEVLRGLSGLPALLERAERTEGRLITSRDASFLGWRYARAPLLGYRALVEGDPGDPAGLAIFRVRPRGTLEETTIADLIVGPGDGHVARRLLRRVVRSAPVDHVTAHLAQGSTAARAASAVGFFRSKRGMVLVVNPLREGLRPDPMALASWGLALGDLEVF